MPWLTLLCACGSRSTPPIYQMPESAINDPPEKAVNDFDREALPRIHNRMRIPKTQRRGSFKAWNAMDKRGDKPQHARQQSYIGHKE